MIDSSMQIIRKKLHLFMNGVSSSSMKEKGINYRLNWGVPTPSLRNIAKDFFPNNELAEELWKQDVREMKILATLIQDPNTFQQANEWVKEVSNSELAEQIVMNLLSKLDSASLYANKWIQSEERFEVLVGFLLYTRLFINSYTIQNKTEQEIFIHKALESLNKSLINTAAYNSLFHFTNQNEVNKQLIQDIINTNSSIDSSIKDILLDIC